MIVSQQFLKWSGLVLAACVLSACGGLAGEPAIVATLPPQPTTAAQTISLPQTAPDMALGAQLFAENCTRCHGVTGKGDGEMVQSGQVTGVPDFTDPNVSRDAAPVDWFEIVTNGRLDKLMPPWGSKLSDPQRWAVTMYVYTLAVDPQQIAQGQAVWDGSCAECHGQAGEGTAKGAPLPTLLKSSQADLLRMLADGIPDKMPSFTDKLSGDEQSAVVAYARTLELKTGPREVAGAPTPEGNTIQEPLATEEVNTRVVVAGPVTTEEVSTAAAAKGSVSGKVVNNTSGATVPADLTVNLHIVSGQNAQTASVTIDADGNYRFEDVSIQSGSQYVVTTSYKGTAFSSEVAEGDPTRPELDLPLPIYEVGDDPTEVRIDGIMTMVQVSAQPSALQVVQILSFTNNSDRVFLKDEGGSTSSVSVRLPTGAVFQDFSGGENLLSADGQQVIDSQPLLPGDSRVMHVGFTLPYSGSINIDQPVDFNLDGPVEVMLDSSSLSITGDGFSPLGTRQLGDRSYTSFGGAMSREAGQSLRYQINGSPAAAQTEIGAVSSLNLVAYILIGAGLLAIGAAFGFFFRERTPARAHAGPGVNANSLIKQIADLDVQFNNGLLVEERYRKQRAALKAQLTALMKDKAANVEAPPDEEP